jgi:hypothetical protein
LRLKSSFFLNLLVAFSSLQSSIGLAQEVREFFNGARMMAMGGASIAVVNDETALLSNPAGLGKLRDLYGTVIDPELALSGNISELYRKKALTQFFDLGPVKEALDLSRDSYYYARGQIFPSFVARNFGFGIFNRYELSAKMNQDGTLMSTSYYDDLAVLLGFNFRLLDGRLKLGVTGKAVSRIEINKDIDASGSLDKSAHASEGFGIGSDVGLILTAPWAWLPTLSVVARDVGGIQFESGSGLRMKTETRPVKVEQDYDVALAFFPIHGNKKRSSFTIEHTQIQAATKASDKTRFYHLGYELNLSDLVFIRAGMNQKFWTGGFEFASERLQFQLTSYGEDVGTDGSSEENRRFVFKFALRF